VVEAATGVFEFTNIGICAFDESVNKWTIKSFRTKDETAPNIQGTIINIQSSLVGKSMTTNNTVWVSPVNDDIIRFNQDEIPGCKRLLCFSSFEKHLQIIMELYLLRELVHPV